MIYFYYTSESSEMYDILLKYELRHTELRQIDHNRDISNLRYVKESQDIRMVIPPHSENLNMFTRSNFWNKDDNINKFNITLILHYSLSFFPVMKLSNCDFSRNLV